MQRSVFIILVLTFNAVLNAQQDPLIMARDEFHKGTEASLKKVIALSVSPENALISAYQGASKARMPEYVLNPLSKIKYFNQGTEMLDASLKKKKDTESVYLRLMIQLNAPGFLNYNKQIDEDLAFFIKNIGTANLSPEIKSMFVSNLKKGNKHAHNLSSLETLKF
ncbi:MAG: hypothetical protein U5K51_11415 [Flavobacteriaceae bacterium]|nr:hypothetical protein [Flavobacteriaceae bacterium]